MQSQIAEIWYGNLNTQDRTIRQDSRYAKLLRLMCRHEEKLLAELVDSQRKAFELYRDCSAENNSLGECAAFVQGFRLGLRLAAESMLDIKTEFDYPEE